MNLSFGNIVQLFRPSAGPTQGQLNQQIAQGGGSENARDRMVKDERRNRSMKMTGNRVAQSQMLDKAGVTKPAAAKRG